MAGVGSRPVRRLSRALSRGGADGHGGRRRAARPASLSMWLLAVTRSPAPRYVRSVRVTRPTVPPIVLPFKITVKGAPSGRVRAPHGRPLSSDLARQTHWH